MGIVQLYRISPLGIVGATITGMMLGGFYGLGAVYASRIGMPLGDIAVFMSAVIIGGVALQWPLGRLSDVLDRRKVIVGAFGGATLASVAIMLTSAPGPLLLILGGLFGGLSFALYPLCVAHANDHLAPEQRVSASGGLVLAYSLGAVAGPVLGAAAMTAIGAAGLFLFIALGAAAALGFAIWRERTGRAVPSERQQPYQILPRTTPMSATLDPLSPEEA